jgi:ankyrin repeat protein
MKVTLFALVVGLLLVGCRQDNLHEAAEVGNLELIEKEILEGANINSQNGRDGETPLQRAATRGQIEAAELLLSKGADVNICRKRDGQTALDLAEARGHEELAELLKKNGGRSSPDR